MTAKVTAAPTTLVFDEGLDSESIYTFHPLKDKDYDELDYWMQSQVMQAAKLGLSPTMSPEERQEILAVATQEAAATTFTTRLGSRLVGSVSGAAMLCYLSIRESHPAVTYETLKHKLRNDKNAAALRHAWNEVNGLPDSMPSKNGEGARAQ